MQPINQITQSWGLIAGARVGARRVFEVLDTEADLQGRQPQLPAGRRARRHRLARCQLPLSPRHAGPERHRSHGAGRRRRSRSSARPAPANRRCSGCCRGFSIRPAASSTIDGVDMREYTLKSLRSQIAMVLQPPLIFPLSVRDNIAYGRPGADRRGDRERGPAGAHPRHDRALPEGYDTVIGEAGVALSEGEKQRDHDRPRAVARRADPDPRRADLGARCRDRGAGHGGDRDG